MFATRISVLVNSFTFGLFNCQEVANPKIVEGLLRERLKRDDIAALNAGVANGFADFLIGESLVT